MAEPAPEPVAGPACRLWDCALILARVLPAEEPWPGQEVVELGCGYTTLFLAQALRDAARDAEEESVRSANWPEEQRWLLWGSAKSDRLIQEWARRGAYWGRGELWERAKRPYAPTLQCVDSFGSEDWQAADYEQTARQLRHAITPR